MHATATDEVGTSTNGMAAFGTADPVAADRLRRGVADADPVLARAPAWSDLGVTSLAARLKDELCGRLGDVINQAAW
jgi:hypothetical protein